jgi:dephospho-CoA kinase
MIKLIGISGKKRSGKNTMARVFMETLNDLQIAQLAFGDVVKDEVCQACGVSREFLEANKDLFRPMLQWWGTEFRRKLHGDDYWIRRLFDKLGNLPGEIFIISDVRFLNEMQALTSVSGSTLIRIQRAVDFTDMDKHASEVELDASAFYYTIMNNGTLEEFERDCARFANRVLVQRLGLAMRGEPD